MMTQYFFPAPNRDLFFSHIYHHIIMSLYIPFTREILLTSIIHLSIAEMETGSRSKR